MFKKVLLISILSLSFGVNADLESLKSVINESQNTPEAIAEEKVDVSNLTLNLDAIKEEIESSEKIKKTQEENEDPNISYLRGVLSNTYPEYLNSVIEKMTEIDGFYEATSQRGNTVYIHKSGDYIVPIIAKIKNGKVEDFKLSKKQRMIANEIKNFNRENFVTYKAKNEVEEIFVFSDYTCPYCKRLHDNLQSILDMGVTVHYIPFPRNGVRDKNTLNGLRNIVCSESPDYEFNLAFNDRANYHKKISPLTYGCEKGTTVLHESLTMADKIQVNGTPYILYKNGAHLGGWTNLSDFRVILNAEIAKSKGNN